MKQKVSIIIPLQSMNDNLKESVGHILNQEYRNFEIILLPNDPLPSRIFPKKVRVIPLGNIQPAEKRNIGAKRARGKILAFIDDDAYPIKRDWLSHAAEYFTHVKEVGAVGGPSFTPPQDGTFQVVSGEVLASPLFSGPASIRYKRGPKGPYHDLPSCNLFVEKKVFEAVGGFYPHFWPGEDTKLCADIIRAQKKVLYDPDIDVYHHRRKGWESYIRQTFRFGFHRGIFMKLFPYTSLRLIFFLPAFFVLGLLFGPWLAFLHPSFLTAYSIGLVIYLLSVFVGASLTSRLTTIPLFMLIGCATHVSYGIGVIAGIFKSSNRSQLKPKRER